MSVGNSGAKSGAMTNRSGARHGPGPGTAPAPSSGPAGQSRQAWVPEPGTVVMVISGSPALHGEVGRVSAAAAVGLVIAETVEQCGGRWDGIAAILIGSDVEGGLPGWRGPTVVVGPAGDSGRMWLQASQLSADRVAVLPDSAQWLANYLTRLRDPGSGAGILGVVGGCGGSGASTLAALLAAGAAVRGTRTLLVDGDEWGGGLDVAIAAEGAAGLRWPDLRNASGAINPEQLAASLPQAAGMSLLSWGPQSGASQVRSPGATGTSEAMHAAREAYGLVVVDLGRSPDSVAALGAHCDSFVVVVPGRLRAAAAAARVLAELPAAPVGLAIRGPMLDGVDAALVAATVGAPPIGEFPRLRRVGDALESGRLRDVARGRRMRALITGVLDWMAMEGGPATEQARRTERGIP